MEMIRFIRLWRTDLVPKPGHVVYEKWKKDGKLNPYWLAIASVSMGVVGILGVTAFLALLVGLLLGLQSTGPKSDTIFTVLLFSILGAMTVGAIGYLTAALGPLDFKNMSLNSAKLLGLGKQDFYNTSGSRLNQLGKAKLRELAQKLESAQKDCGILSDEAIQADTDFRQAESILVQAGIVPDVPWKSYFSSTLAV